MKPLIALDLWEWIEQHRQAFEPPVGNKVIWEDSRFTAMIVRGPNVRRDFHIDPSDEIFYMLKGDMVLEKAAIAHFDASVELRTCRRCGHVQPDTPPLPQRPSDERRR